MSENFSNPKNNETKQNENFGSQLGYFENDTDDYSFEESENDESVSYYGGNESLHVENESLHVGNESLHVGSEPHNEWGSVVTFPKGGKALSGYPPFLDGVLPTFENDEKRHLTEPQYKNTFYVVDEKDSKLIVAYFLCIFLQIPVITNKFLKELKIIPPELGVYPELKQPFAFKPHVEFENQIRFQIPSAYKDQDLYKKFIHLIGGIVVDNSIQNRYAFTSSNGIDKTIYTFVNEGDTNKRLFGELSIEKVCGDGDVTITWEWVKCMVIKQCYIKPYEYFFPHRSPN
ncbi:hypothetical protein QTN25_002469 [Entamoeba marina]